MRTISTNTQLCAVIGNPIKHSLSPAIHNAAFEHLDLDFVYVAFPIEDVKSLITGMRAIPNFRGMSVTIPHKSQVIKYVDEISEVDRNIGAINTVIQEDGKLVGFGTDGAGALKAFVDSGVELDGKNILMLGAGGAARAIAFTLAWEKDLAELTILDINADMLKKLSTDLRNGTSAVINSELSTEKSLAQAMERADVIIHCSPVGMFPKVDASLVPPELFRPGQVVMDIVYTPLKTKLLTEAEAAGLKIIPGIEMFVNQAALQFERFANKEAPVDVMRRVLLENLEK
jgi:shikimate dehydrogenase